MSVALFATICPPSPSPLLLGQSEGAPFRRAKNRVRFLLRPLRRCPLCLTPQKYLPQTYKKIKPRRGCRFRRQERKGSSKHRSVRGCRYAVLRKFSLCARSCVRAVRVVMRVLCVHTLGNRVEKSSLRRNLRREARGACLLKLNSRMA